MKVVFLDIDGVLNDNDYQRGKPQIMPQFVEAFNQIIRRTGAKIVLSSSWRMGIYEGLYTVRGFAALLESHGVEGALIGCTPKPGQFDTRGEEVMAWLKAKAEAAPQMDSPVTAWVAIDDWGGDEFTACGERFVHVDPGNGLTKAQAAKAIAILNDPLFVVPTIHLQPDASALAAQSQGMGE